MSPVETLITLTPPSFVVDVTSGYTLARSLYDGIGRYIFPIRSFSLEVPRIGLPRAVYMKAQTMAVDPANSPMTVLEWLLRNLNLRPDQIYALPGSVRSIAATDLTVGDIVIHEHFRHTVTRVEITNDLTTNMQNIRFWTANGTSLSIHPRGTLLVERDA